MCILFRIRAGDITEGEYENFKYLYETLKMRNLSDLNDLFIHHDIRILCEILLLKIDLNLYNKLRLSILDLATPLVL